MRGRVWVCVGVLVLYASGAARGQADPLPSWNDLRSKKAIVAFVAKVTKEGGPDFVKPEERTACFDNDGTLWCEQPAYFQLIFALDRIKALAPKNPQWTRAEPYKSVLAGNTEEVLRSGEKGLMQILAVSHAGMTVDQFNDTVKEWLATAKHPRFDKPYTQLVYQPMIELLAYLRANGFKTFIVSGGGVEFMRCFAEPSYGIPPEQVVGSSGVVQWDMRESGPALLKMPKIDFIDDGPGKPVGINKFIGRRPLMAFGNSDGDLQMLQWTASRAGPSFGLIVHHTDEQREYKYDRDSHIGKLDRALDEAGPNGWTVVDMKADWNKVFAFEK